MQVNVARNGVNLGAFELDTLKLMAAEGKLLVTDHVYLAKDERWDVIERIPELRTALFPARAVPPPPPPPPAPSQQFMPPPPMPTKQEVIEDLGFQTSVPATSDFGRMRSSNDSIDVDPDEQLLKDKLGANADRYVKRFRANKGKTIFVSWNWAAFLTGPFWTAYRSLWPFAIGFAVLAVGCTYAYGQFSLPRFLFNGVPLLAAIVLGLLGDSLVIQSILKKGKDGPTHQVGKQRIIGGAFGAVTISVLMAIGMLASCWNCNDEEFAEYAMTRVINGWDGVNDLIDWPNLKTSGQDVGGLYNAMPDPLEAQRFQFAFIDGFSKEAKKQNVELHRYRMVGSQGAVRFVRATGNGREFEIHVVQTDNGKRIQAFFPVESSN